MKQELDFWRVWRGAGFSTSQKLCGVVVDIFLKKNYVHPFGRQENDGTELLVLTWV